MEHEHVIVSPVGKDTLKVKDADGVKQEVPKVLHQVGLGEIHSDILTANPQFAKGGATPVGERSFRYIISATGYVRRFKANHMIMCGCTDCVGGHSLHATLNGWRGKMKRMVERQQAQRRGRAAQVATARGYGKSDWHPRLSDACNSITCDHPLTFVPRFACQTCTCDDCPEYRIPAEEQREDIGMPRRSASTCTNT